MKTVRRPIIWALVACAGLAGGCSPLAAELGMDLFYGLTSAISQGGVYDLLLDSMSGIR